MLQGRGALPPRSGTIETSPVSAPTPPPHGAAPDPAMEQARLEELLHPAATADVPFYGRLVRVATAEVLELGCGGGRLTLPLADVGATITGVDNDPAALAVLAEKLRDRPALARRTTLLLQDLRTLALGPRFGLVIVPSNNLQLFPTAPLRAAVLRTVVSHLLPQGRAAIDVTYPDLDEELMGQWLLQSERAHPSGGTARQLVRVQRRGTTADQQWDVSYRFEHHRTDGSVQTFGRDHVLGYFYPEQGRAEMEAAGLEVRHIHGDYGGTAPSGAGQPRQLYELRLPTATREAALSAATPRLGGGR